MTARLLYPLLISSLTFASCASQPEETPEPPTEDVTPMTETIDETAWIASKIYGEDAKAGRSTLSIVAEEEGELIASGSTACNNYRGGVEIDGVTIEFGLLAATRRLCSPAINGQEQAFLEALEAARYWARVGGTLKLLDPKNQVVMELVDKADEHQD